jgi:hypothetical protein
MRKWRGTDGKLALICVPRERRGAYRIMVGRSEGRSPLGRTRSRWEDNVKMDL